MLLIAQEIITGHDRSELSLLLKGLQVIPNPRPYPDFLPTWWRELSYVKPLGLFVQQEDVAVRAAGRVRTAVVRYKGRVACYEVCDAVRVFFGFETWLDP